MNYEIYVCRNHYVLILQRNCAWEEMSDNLYLKRRGLMEWLGRFAWDNNPPANETDWIVYHYSDYFSEDITERELIDSINYSLRRRVQYIYDLYRNPSAEPITQMDLSKLKYRFLSGE